MDDPLKDPRVVEFPVLLPQSKLWEIQRNYFESMGIDAWKEQVPFYISSNAFIGQRYALLVLNFIRDWKKLHPHSTAPFYIAELGSGTGKFSFHFLTAFKELLKIYAIDNVKFCYIVSDATRKNIDYCQKNSSLAPFVEAGELDFSYFDVESSTDFNLIKQQKNYSDLHSKTPLIIIGNYTFDCIKQDSIEFKEGKPYGVKLGLRSRYKDFDTNKSLHLNELFLDFTSEPIEINKYYENPILNSLLASYQATFAKRQAMVMIPLGAIQFFDHIKQLTQDNFFMICGDKGIATAEMMPVINDRYRATYDGCYSFPVNFHAMGFYLQKNGGDALITRNHNDFKVNLFSMGTEFSELVETKGCFESLLENTGPDEYCYMFDEYFASAYRFNLRGLLSFLRFSYWDPDAYAAVHERMVELFSAADVAMKEEIKRDLEKVRNNIYRINIGHDVYNYLGIFYQKQKDFPKALELYLQSLTVFGDKTAPHNNIALIYEQEKNYAKALDHYQKSYALDKKNAFAHKKIYQLTGRPFMAASGTIVKAIFVAVVLFGIIYYIQK